MKVDEYKRRVTAYLRSGKATDEDWDLVASLLHDASECECFFSPAMDDFHQRVFGEPVVCPKCGEWVTPGFWCAGCDEWTAPLPDLVDEFRRLLEATRYIQDCDRHYDTYRELCTDSEQRGVLFEMTRERQDAIRRGRGRVTNDG